METVLEMSNVSKTFYGDGVEVKATDSVNFSLKRGEIHALLGENGAGKSTLVNSLFRKPDSGSILIFGEEVELNDPLTAIRYGLGIARQDLTKSLVERHTIAENILSISYGFFLSLNKIEEKIKKVLKEFDMGDLDPKMRVWKLSGGEKQRVEILKALITDPKIIILDEPTSMLTPIEIKNLFKLLELLKERGKSIVLITHHLEEAIEFSDRITILRQGKVIDTLDTNEAKKQWKNHTEGIRSLAKLMVGKEVLYDLKRNPLEANRTVLEAENVVVNNDMGDQVVNGVSFHLKENQILGLAGISGNGQRELAEAVLNLRKPESGTVKIRREISNSKSIREIRNLGVAFIPEDRRKAIVPDLSVRENLMLNSYQDDSGLLIDNAKHVKETENLIEQFKIKTPSPSAPVRTLSGGNKQKVVVAREFSLKPPDDSGLILIAENPTFGLDVGTTQFVREELLKMRSSGAAILLISSDLTEILTLSDVVAVLYKGKIMGVLEADEANRENIGMLMGGVKSEVTS